MYVREGKDLRERVEHDLVLHSRTDGLARAQALLHVVCTQEGGRKRDLMHSKGCNGGMWGDLQEKS